MDTQDTENPSRGYLLLIRSTNWDEGMSPEELQKAMGNFMGWVESLKATGKLIDAAPLTHEGKVVSGPKGKIVADGPFAESKEAIGGYFALDVDTMDEAVKMAQGCPVYDFGGSIEVRQIATICPKQQKLNEALQSASV